jgi:hypothetical protein
MNTTLPLTESQPLACCRHCKRAKVNRPRGLCWSCYYTAGVRAKYPSTSKYARRGLAVNTVSTVQPPVPTTAAPGTPEKLKVMEMRIRNKQALWHPLDACFDGDPRPLEWLQRAGINP